MTPNRRHSQNCILFDYEVFRLCRVYIDSADRRLRIHCPRFGQNNSHFFKIYQAVNIEDNTLIWQAGVAHSRSYTSIFCRKKLRYGKSIFGRN